MLCTTALATALCLVGATQADEVPAKSLVFAGIYLFRVRPQLVAAGPEIGAVPASIERAV